MLLGLELRLKNSDENERVFFCRFQSFVVVFFVSAAALDNTEYGLAVLLRLPLSVVFLSTCRRHRRRRRRRTFRSFWHKAVALKLNSNIPTSFLSLTRCVYLAHSL